MELIEEKINQTRQLLDEFNIDMWLLFVRETSVIADPVMPLVAGHHVVWPSFFAYTRSGEAIAIVGELDKNDFERCGWFTEVISYNRGVSQEIRKLLDRFDPKTIGINYSLSNPTSDGITYGMYLLLKEYLEGTAYSDRFVSAEDICSRVRSRKTASEIDRITKAENLTLRTWDSAVENIQVGMTEIEIAELIEQSMINLGGVCSFPTIVNAGSKTEPGHGTPTVAHLEPGDLLHVDLGTRVDSYCSDIQRLMYVRRSGESEAPPELIRAFDLVKRIIQETARVAVPGALGYEIDSLARKMLRDEGYPEFQHALGHQLGRSVHDGGALIGPKWERYGPTPSIPIEEGNVFTLELEIVLPGIGCVGLEEDVCVTRQGGRFLAPCQQELVLK